MKRFRFLAILAGVILGVGALAAAQEGYSGQEATNQPAQQGDSGSRLVAGICPHMQGATSLSAAACAPKGARETSSKQEKVTRHIQGAPVPTGRSQQEGDPNASQNYLYDGGGA